MAKHNEVKFTKQLSLGLLRTYNNAVQSGKKRTDTFRFDGKEFVVNYAYYLLQHLANEFQDPSLNPVQKANE